MEDALCKEIFGSPYVHNSTHSESVSMLWFIRHSLPEALKKMSQEYKKDEIKIRGLVMAIASWRDLCPGCKNLVHGFQHASKNILALMSERYKLTNIEVGSEYSTLALTEGQVRVGAGKGAEKVSPDNECAWLCIAPTKDRNDHELVMSRTQPLKDPKSILNDLSKKTQETDKAANSNVRRPQSKRSTKMRDKQMSKNGGWNNVGKSRGRNSNNQRKKR